MRHFFNNDDIGWAQNRAEDHIAWQFHIFQLDNINQMMDASSTYFGECLTNQKNIKTISRNY